MDISKVKKVLESFSSQSIDGLSDIELCELFIGEYKHLKGGE